MESIRTADGGAIYNPDHQDARQGVRRPLKCVKEKRFKKKKTKTLFIDFPVYEKVPLHSVL